MKKLNFILGIVCVVLSTLINTSCLTTAATTYRNMQIDIPFDGPMDTKVGYENLSWGTTYKNIDKNVYPLTNTKEGTNYICCYIGETNSYDGKKYDIKYGHATYVEDTRLYFDSKTKRLYRVVEHLNEKNPSLEYLHSRYGDFNETNVANDEFKKEGGVVYTNRDSFDNRRQTSLEIDIYESGEVIVFMYDWNFNYTLNYVPLIDIHNNKYSSAYDKDKVKSNVWYCYSNTDTENKRIVYTFLNQNDDGKFLLVGYTKSLESPALSQVRAGICWWNNTSGTYEIKTKEGTNTVKYDTSRWSCVPKDETYTYTESNSTRNMIKFFIENENFTVRHNNEVSSFVCTGLLEELSRFGITAEELDFAIANEEF